MQSVKISMSSESYPEPFSPRPSASCKRCGASYQASHMSLSLMDESIWYHQIHRSFEEGSAMLWASFFWVIAPPCQVGARSWSLFDQSRNTRLQFRPRILRPLSLRSLSMTTRGYQQGLSFFCGRCFRLAHFYSWLPLCYWLLLHPWLQSFQLSGLSSFCDLCRVLVWSSLRVAPEPESVPCTCTCTCRKLATSRRNLCRPQGLLSASHYPPASRFQRSFPAGRKRQAAANCFQFYRPSDHVGWATLPYHARGFTYGPRLIVWRMLGPSVSAAVAMLLLSWLLILVPLMELLP